jgi:hypothetical protein
MMVAYDKISSSGKTWHGLNKNQGVRGKHDE